MGVKFLQHMGGRQLYCCVNCGANLTNSESRVSTQFYARTGQAYLFRKVVNVIYGEVAEERIMTTGSHIVRDAMCKNCNKIIGWMYEFAKEPAQQYKEGSVILERLYIRQRPGIKEI